MAAELKTFVLENHENELSAMPVQLCGSLPASIQASTQQTLNLSTSF